MALARMVRNLDTVQKVQGAALTPAQAKELIPILNQLKSAEKLPAADADKQTAALEKILTPAQKEALSALQPARGAGGGGGFGGGGGGGGYGGGGGARPDPEKPFASERNKAALDSLIGQLGKAG